MPSGLIVPNAATTASGPAAASGAARAAMYPSGAERPRRSYRWTALGSQKIQPIVVCTERALRRVIATQSGSGSVMVRHGSRSTMAHNAPMKRERTLEQLRQRGVHLEWATNGWNVMEVVVTISLGLQAGSLALIAFGLDSVVEIFASTVVIRNLRDRRSDPGDRRVHRSLRMIAGAFWILAAFLVAISVRGLIRGDRPDSSPLGVAYLALTAVAMFGLSLLKRRIARELGSEALQAEAALTFLDGCLSTGILAALLLNSWLGWWWSDAAAALARRRRRGQGGHRPLARVGTS